ncbi:MAG: hypothetical protein ACK58L_18580 [Planctomycetota bacterium]
MEKALFETPESPPESREIASANASVANSQPRKWPRRLFSACVAAAAISGAWVSVEKWKASRFEQACAEARKQRDWRTLRKVAREWIQWDPGSSKGWWRAAEAAQKLEDLEDMAECLGNISPEDPKYAFALAEKANLEWTALNRPLDALKTSETAITIDPRLLEVHSRIISFYAMTLQRVPMLRAARRAMSQHAEPKETYAYVIVADNLTFSNAIDINGRWLSACPDEPMFKVGLGVQTAMNVMLKEASSRNDDVVIASREAQSQIQWFLDALPGNPVLLAFLLHQAYQKGDVSRVAQLLQQVSDDGAQDHMIWVYRGWYHTQSREYEEAEKSFLEARRLHPISPLAWHEHAQLLRAMQNPDAEKTQRLAAYGRELRSQVLQLSSAAEITPALMLQVQSYAATCGDEVIANAAANRLRNLSIQ